MRLSLNGPSPSLLAPGLPDWIGADGERVGWALRDVLFWLQDDAVVCCRVPDLVEDLAAAAGSWTVATAYGAAQVHADGRLGALLTVSEGEPLAVQPGRDCVLVVDVPSHSLVRLSTGEALPIPDAATRARLHGPFQSGEGMVWVDLDFVYRLRVGQQPASLGRAPAATAMTVGPDGAVLVAVAGDTLVAPPRGPLARLGQAIHVVSARFSPDGLRVLAADEDGAVEIDLVKASVLRRWEGSYAPVGYAPDVRLLDQAAGTLVDDAGNVKLAGFLGAAPSLGGTWLAGPGGAVWNLRTGERLRGGLNGDAAATNGVHVAVADATHIHVLDGARFPHSLLDGDDAIDRMAFVDDTLVITSLDGRGAGFSLAGAQLWTSDDADDPAPDAAAPAGIVFTDPSEPSETRVDDRVLPIPADGAHWVGTAAWLWTDEGMLVSV